ncbi:hypothetical protein GCM10020221_09420 [Streptomyces thioluteus]|uniref:Uncharacterized protein n=1 Tax=Streptomyces thioluteus TaxID=66431 RepID=A0ABN3WIH6_STRTU
MAAGAGSRGAQTASATSAGTLHRARPPAHDSDSASRSGTVVAAATAPPPTSMVVCRPDISPTRRSKSLLINAVMTTLATATAVPARNDPANSGNVAGTSRTAVPHSSTARTATSVRSMPQRRASRGASGAKTPKQISGSVESAPAPPLDRPVACRMSSRRGETATMAGRMLIPTSSTARA